MGADDIFRNPENGEYISKMIRMAAETASAPTSRVTITVGLGGARRPKLKNIATIQETKNHQKRHRDGVAFRLNEEQPTGLSQFTKDGNRLSLGRRLPVTLRFKGFSFLFPIGSERLSVRDRHLQKPLEARPDGR